MRCRRAEIIMLVCLTNTFDLLYVKMLYGEKLCKYGWALGNIECVDSIDNCGRVSADSSAAAGAGVAGY